MVVPLIPPPREKTPAHAPFTASHTELSAEKHTHKRPGGRKKKSGWRERSDPGQRARVLAPRRPASRLPGRRHFFFFFLQRMRGKKQQKYSNFDQREEPRAACELSPDGRGGEEEPRLRGSQTSRTNKPATAPKTQTHTHTPIDAQRAPCGRKFNAGQLVAQREGSSLLKPRSDHPAKTTAVSLSTAAEKEKEKKHY